MHDGDVIEVLYRVTEEVHRYETGLGSLAP